VVSGFPWKSRRAGLDLPPSGLALKAFNRLISYAQGWEALRPFLLGLAGFLVLFTALSAGAMRRTVE